MPVVIFLATLIVFFVVGVNRIGSLMKKPFVATKEKVKPNHRENTSTDHSEANTVLANDILEMLTAYGYYKEPGKERIMVLDTFIAEWLALVLHGRRNMEIALARKQCLLQYVDTSEIPSCVTVNGQVRETKFLKKQKQLLVLVTPSHIVILNDLEEE